MTKPLEGIKIIDFTHVQAGPAATQMLAWFGADVIKVERPGSGDVTRSQLRHIPDADALYFTMLNSNKKSLTLDTKTAKGKKVLERLIKESDVLVENFAPGALDRMGFTWEHIHELNPGMIVASVKGFSDGHHFEDLKVYENVAQAAGGAASTTGFWDGPPTVSGAALGDSNTGMHLVIGILTALHARDKNGGKGQKVSVSMQDAVINLVRVKLRDQQRLDATGILEEYPQYPHGQFTDVVPRGGNAGGGGQPGWVLKCKGWETDPNAYIYFTIQGHAWPKVAEAIGKPEWIDDPAYNTAIARQDKIFDIFSLHRGMAVGQNQVRGGRHPAPVRHSVRAGAVDEGDRQRSVAAQKRHDRRGESPGHRQVPDRRQPDQILRCRHRHHGVAAARPAHERRAERTSATRRKQISELHDEKAV